MKLVMISAMYENGGNTFHRMLDGHPNLLVYPFESQVGTGVANDFLTSYVPSRYRWPEFTTGTSIETAYEAFWDEELKTLLRVPGRSKFRTCGLEMDEQDRIAKFTAYLQGKELTRANATAAFFHSTFEAWKNCNKSGEETFWVGYNPVQLFDTDKILSDFPDGHVIHVIRNPWSCFADTCKRPFPLGLKRYTWTWNLCQHFALTYKEKHPKNFHIIRFEDMVADPANAIGKVLEEIGLPPSENCTYPSFNKTKLEEVFPWGTIRIPTPEANRKTADEITKEEQKQIATEASVMIRLLGYDNFL
jgi:hypothetical protein